MQQRIVFLLITCVVFGASGLEAKNRGKGKNAREAAKAFAEGSKRFDQRDYVGAIEAFEQAYRLKPHFLVQCNMARCHERSGDMVKAREHYLRCLDEGGRISAMSSRLEDALKDVESRITWVVVNSKGKGGDVFLDGKLMGKAPVKFPISPGSRVIEVRRAGARPANTTIVTRGGETKDIVLSPVDFGAIESQRDDNQTGDKQKKLDTEKTFDSDQWPMPPPQKEGLSQAWFWTSAALSVALAGTAVYLGITTLNLKTEYEKNPTQESYDSAIDRRLLTNIFWGAAAAMAGTSTTLFFFTDFNGSKDNKMSFSVGVQGRF